MKSTPRQRYLSYVRDPNSSRPIVSPFLPHADVVRNTLSHLGLSAGEDAIENEISLARELDYEPMFMTEMPNLIFNWQVDKERSDNEWEVSCIETAKGLWEKRVPKRVTSWNEEVPCAVQSEKDHEKLVLACEQVSEGENEIRLYFRKFRQKVGDDGVIVIGHPHPSWLGHQISPQKIFYHWTDMRETFIRSMNAIYDAAIFVMATALDEGIDFTSDSSYGLEMTSPRLFEEMDLPYIQKFSSWTHDQNSLFWYHNCGFTRELILDGKFNQLGADVIETIAPPPEGDNELSESRRHLNARICTKGNLNLHLLRDGSPDQIAAETKHIVDAVRGYPHIISTADAVLPGTPPENFIVFITEAREAYN